MTPPWRRLMPWIVGAAACLLYLATLSNHYTGDSIEYALAIEMGYPAQLLDPFHPLLHPAGLLFLRLWQLAGWTGRALLPLEVLNALAGGLCAGLLASIAGVLSGSGGIAAVAGLGFAASGGLWMLSVEAEFVTLPLALLLAVLWAVLCASPAAAARSRYPVILGLATVAAVAGYASSALLVPVVLVSLLADGRLKPALRRRHCLVYMAAVLLLLVPAYLAFLAAWSGGQWEQVPAYFLGNSSYGRFVPFSLPHGIYAFLRSLALYPNLSLVGTTRQFLAQASPAGRLLFAGYYCLILLVVLAPLWLAWRRRRSLWPAHRRPLLALGTWSVLFSAFAFYWVPGDQSFWLPVLAAWWLLIALVLATTEIRGFRLAAVLAGVAVLAAGNALFEVVPRHDIRWNTGYQAAQQVIANTTSEDIVLVRGDDITGLYLTYLGGDRQVLYVSSEPEGLVESLSPIEAAQGVPAGRTPRLITVDSDSQRAGWWHALLESLERAAPRGWRSSSPDWRTEGSLVFELHFCNAAAMMPSAVQPSPLRRQISTAMPTLPDDPVTRLTLLCLRGRFDPAALDAARELARSATWTGTRGTKQLRPRGCAPCSTVSCMARASSLTRSLGSCRSTTITTSGATRWSSANWAACCASWRRSRSPSSC